MKSFKEVEAARRAYHRDGALNSVHRSSLTVPEIEGSQATISFINHFLLKRNYPNVGCRITALDPSGHRIESRLLKVDEPRVYTVPLSGMVSEPVNGYLIEFFAAENLFIPFPAVMVNHHGPQHHNSVHAYNRILNDVFEDDAINANSVSEASIDVHIDETTDTFAVFTAGPQPCHGKLEIELMTASGEHSAEIALEVPRLCSREISLRKTFPDLPPTTSGTLKLKQPSQFLFYGRMLTGMRRKDDAFSANHSYYDSSASLEYWNDDQPSLRLYPFFQRIDNKVRMYPIMSPGRLKVGIEMYDRNGSTLATTDAGSVQSPSARPLDFSVNQLCDAAGIDHSDVAAFLVRAAPEGGKTPTRVNHQLVHGSLSADNLNASVNVSLTNPNVFIPKGKTGFAWGQIPVGSTVESVLGIVGNSPQGNGAILDVTLYDEQGSLGTRAFELKEAAAIHINAAEIDTWRKRDNTDTDDISYVWYTATAKRPDLTGYVVTHHTASGHFSGEHSF